MSERLREAYQKKKERELRSRVNNLPHNKRHLARMHEAGRRFNKRRQVERNNRTGQNPFSASMEKRTEKEQRGKPYNYTFSFGIDFKECLFEKLSGGCDDNSLFQTELERIKYRKLRCVENSNGPISAKYV